MCDIALIDIVFAGRMQDYLQYVQSGKYQTSHLQPDMQKHIDEVQNSCAEATFDKSFQRFQRRIASEPSQVGVTYQLV